MKVGFFGGIILLGLTLLFSVIAIQNNKLARAIVIKNFNVTQKQDVNESNISKEKIKIIIKKDEFDDFEKKFRDFDKKFENF